MSRHFPGPYFFTPRFSASSSSTDHFVFGAPMPPDARALACASSASSSSSVVENSRRRVVGASDA